MNSKTLDGPREMQRFSEPDEVNEFPNLKFL